MEYQAYKEFRSQLLRDLRRQLFGPTPNGEQEDLGETLSVSPLQLYGTGILFPQRLSQNLLEDSVEREPPAPLDGDLPNLPGLETGRRTATPDDTTGDDREPLNLANEFSPSASGISFRLKQPARLVFVISYGTYELIRVHEPHPRAGSTGADGRAFPETREVPAYQRTHHEQAVEIEIGRTKGSLEPISVEGSSEALKLHLTVRERSDHTLVVSAMLVNHRMTGPSAPPSCDDVFCQVSLTVRHADGDAVFLPIDRSLGSAGNDQETAGMDLLYRHRRAFALGHGAAADWTRDESLSERGSTDMVRSEAIPTYELMPIKPREEAFKKNQTLNLSLSFLCDADDQSNPEQAIISALEILANDYEVWISDQEAESKSFATPELKKSAEINLGHCRYCLKRIRRGIQTLAREPRAMMAFRLMNKAMLLQQHHSSLRFRELGSEYPPPPNPAELAGRKWRPFQLAFILMNITSMIDSSDEERSIVDLIWFPTGGGKTEAYLGLAAFTICAERLADSAKGTTVLMRYTLRLLTAQQFQRASALILALETLRRDRALDADLGEEEITIGLWVGQSLSPNTRDQARAALKRMKANKFAQNPFQVLQCPWCGVNLADAGNLGYRDIKLGLERTVRLCCADNACRFSEKKGGLPILVTDEDIYEAPPTILIGTVDKFAQVAWNEKVGRLFGIDASDVPPALIIQDELHLISGPLGTMVGLYETAIDRLCTREGHVHKIVASTATIRCAEQQCWELYARRSIEFPPQAIRAGESYFAFEDQKSPGRLYVGFMGNAVKSHQTALVRACSPLLQCVCYSADEENSKGKLADPYGTLVWYFNSKRELGHAATLCVGDIPEFLKGLCHRLNIPYEDRRYIREIVELTSNRDADEIPAILQQLEIPWRMRPKGPAPVDVLLATNMIAVGVDVSRLGLMVISGQPKSTSEYIQASSRVGRRYPGIVVCVYAQSKSRDRSHYERFISYHQSLYRFVEPTSVTPFSPEARDRGLRGVLIALARLMGGVSTPELIGARRSEVAEEVSFILNRAKAVDEDEAGETQTELEDWLEFWENYRPPKYGRMGGTVSEQTLMYPYGSVPDDNFQREAWPVLTSMRNVDGTSAARVVNVYESPNGTGATD